MQFFAFYQLRRGAVVYEETTSVRGAVAILDDVVWQFSRSADLRHSTRHLVWQAATIHWIPGSDA
jgi:hypothetical protein